MREWFRSESCTSSYSTAPPAASGTDPGFGFEPDLYEPLGSARYMLTDADFDDGNVNLNSDGVD